MKILQPKTWSERQQVVAIIFFVWVVIALLWTFLLTPLNSRRRQLERDIVRMRTELEQKNYLIGEEALIRTRDTEQRNLAALAAEWTDIGARMAVATNMDDSAGTRVGHIDFKVALYDVRQRLVKKSRAMNINLPHDLGMDDAVQSDEDARKLMLQLRTVEKIVDMALDLKIATLGPIHPLPPVTHPAPDTGVPFLEEYPVSIEFYGSLDNLYDLLRAILDEETMFFMRHFRVESIDSGKDTLNARVVLSSAVFLQAGQSVVPAKAQPMIRRTSPLGI